MRLFKTIFLLVLVIEGSDGIAMGADGQQSSSPKVNDFRFPRPDQVSGEAGANALPVSPETSGIEQPNSDVEKPIRSRDIQPSSTVIDSKGGVVGRTDSLGQAVDSGGRVLGPVDSLGRVINPGTGAIGGGVPGSQRGGSSLK